MSSSPSFNTESLNLVNAVADEVRPLSLHYFRQPLSVESKADASPVTRADREVEQLMRRRIGERFPTHGILGEEYGSEQLSSAHVWVIDPIDGTKSFVSGMPTFGTLMALLEHGVPRLGLIDMPAMGERWIGAAGQPSTFNGRPCRTRTGVDLSRAVLYSTSPDVFVGEDVERYESLCRQVGLRRFGGDCYAYGLLAAGWIDGVVESSLQPYDYLALVPVIEGAGGMVTDWEGKALGIESDGRVLAAATPALHRAMLDALDA